MPSEEATASARQSSRESSRAATEAQQARPIHPPGSLDHWLVSAFEERPIAPEWQ